MDYSVTAFRGVQLDLSGETGLPFWKEAYLSVGMMERLLLQFSELYFIHRGMIYLLRTRSYNVLFLLVVAVLLFFF